MQRVHEISPLLDGHFMGPGKANDTPSGLLHHQPAGWAHISPTCETNRWWNARILVMDAMQWRCAKSHGVAHQRQVENSVASLKSGKLRWNLLGSIWVIGDFVTKWKDTQRSKVDSFVKLNGSMVHWCLKFKHIWQHRSFSAKLQKVMKKLTKKSHTSALSSCSCYFSVRRRLSHFRTEAVGNINKEEIESMNLWV